jgi:hypothetical protein
MAGSALRLLLGLDRILSVLPLERIGACCCELDLATFEEEVVELKKKREEGGGK